MKRTNQGRRANRLVGPISGLVFILVVAGCSSEESHDGDYFAQGIRVADVLGDDGESGFAKAETVREFVFPEDHGAHPEYRSEWWYITATLRVPETREEFGVQFTLFRQALTPTPRGSSAWQSGQAYMAHLAVTDVEGGNHEADARINRGHPNIAGVQVAPFKAYIDDWELAEVQSMPWTLALKATTDTGVAVALTMAVSRGPYFQGDQGLSAKGPGQASYYYSIPRMETEGTLTIDGKVASVEGFSWFDREWSTSVLGSHLTGWDWFAFNFDDGRNAMMFNLRRKDGERDPYDHGLLVSASGAATQLATSQYKITPRRYWEDERGVSWPVAWDLVLDNPEGSEHYRVDAMVDDQKVSLGVDYWEGIVRLTDTTGSEVGRGYMELTGYGDSLGQPVD